MRKIINIVFPIFLLISNINCSQSMEPIPDGEGGYILTQINPQFSPDDKMIVFNGGYNNVYAVHLIDSARNYLGYILNDVGHINSPTWAPDNNRLAVSIEGSIFTVNKDGTNLSKIIDSDQDFFCNWSPDGRYIAYTKSICDPECGIALYNFGEDTSNVIGQYGGHAAWNKNSDKVYYSHTYYITDTTTGNGIYKGFIFKRFDVNTLKTDSLFYVKNTNLWLADCTVSPDEKYILFAAAYGSPARLNIWEINLQSKSMMQITFDGGDCPSYNPAGNKIVYTNTNLKEGGLWIMNSDGSNQKRLTKLKE